MQKLCYVLASILMVLTGINASAKVNGIIPSRTYVSKEFNVRSFSSVVSNSIINVEFTQSSGYVKVEVSAPENLMQYVKVGVNKSGVLSLDCESFSVKNFSGNYAITARVTAPSVTAFTSNGTGNIKMLNALNLKKDVKLVSNGTGDISGPTIICNRLEATSTGTGDIEFTSLTCQNLEVNTGGTGDVGFRTVLTSTAQFGLQGTGDIDIKSFSGTSLTAELSGTGDIEIEGGTSASAKFVLTGTGDINAKNLRVGDLTALNHSTGDIECCAVESLTARNNGTGSIKYRGYPQRVDVTGKGIKKIK
ncbi:MAG: DUF2807 domain-containing protein [Muribaculum sp.]|nr:DUF2807 domain-containing protein [Muribaculum sp.]